MVHGEHNKSKNNGGFALIILGALLLFLAPNIYQDMRELGTEV
jgi:ABC-type transport system involved in cytochrome bd biosynthesis fused ATPase/permease subunit